MSQDYQSQFHTITHALEHNNLLSFNEKKGVFEEVGFLGRTWRSLSKLMGNKDAFKDCDAATIGNKIVKFVESNQSTITPSEKEILINDLKTLQKRLSKNYYNIKLNIDKIFTISVGSTSNSRDAA